MMQKYLIDTNIIIELMRSNKSIGQKFVSVGFENCYVSTFTLCELYFGAYNIKHTKYFAAEMNKIKYIYEKFKIITAIADAEVFGEIKAHLYSIGKKVDEFDILIGSLAVEKKMTVVTDNVKHFENMPGVKYENWLER